MTRSTPHDASVAAPLKPRFVMAQKPSARKLVKGDEGAVVMIFAMCASLMMGSMCTVLDTIDFSMTHSRMQMALDVATLSAGADLSHYSSTTGNNLTTWQADALAYYNANMPTGYFALNMPSTNFVANVTGTPSAGQTIVLSASGSMPLIAPIMLASANTSTSNNNSGSNSSSGSSNAATISVSNSAIRLPQSTLELTMVLDNTGSMNDSANGTSTGVSKMVGLQAAANNLISNLYSQSGNNYYVGLVPFASTVNVKGALSSSGSWINPVFTYNATGVQMAADNTHAGWAGCVVEPRDGSGNLSAQAYSPTTAAKFTPYYYNTPPGGLQLRDYSYSNFCGNNPKTTTSNGVPVTLDNYGEPNLCGYSSATSGTGVGVYYDQILNSGNGTKTLTQNSDCIAQPVTFLTNNQNTLTSAINSMTASGSTIIPVGLLWGWRMLSSSWSNSIAGSGGWISTDPTFPKPEATQNLQRVMIVLTDGENQIGAAGTIPNDLYFNGLSGVGSRSLSAPSVTRTNGTTLSNGLTDSSELYGGSVEDPSSGNNAGYPDDVNTFQAAVCTAIKASGVTVYAITFGSDASNSVAQTAMQNCASPGDYYHAPDNTTLNAIFQQIAGNLGELRLVQ